MLKILKTSSIWLFCTIMFITILAWFLKSHLVMSLAGLCLFILVMFPVVLSDFTKKILYFVIKNTNYKEEIISFYHHSHVIKFLNEYPVFFRSVFQTIGFWIVEFYSDLNTFQLKDLVSALNPMNVLLSVLLFILGFLGQFSNKGKFQSRLEWIANVSGNISFYRGLFLLICGISLPSYWELADGFFSDPIWFINNDIKFSILRKIDFSFAFFLIFIFGSLIIIARDNIKNRESTNEKRELGWGLLFMSIWVFTIPMYYFTIFISLIYKMI